VQRTAVVDADAQSVRILVVVARNDAGRSIASLDAYWILSSWHWLCNDKQRLPRRVHCRVWLEGSHLNASTGGWLCKVGRHGSAGLIELELRDVGN